jgi:dTDP-4-amino-4,6-dideoxygalactose transaminase
MIPVTQTYLPPMDDYLHFLRGIWESRHVTNHGPLVSELESKIKEYLGVRHFFFVNNGTTALQIAIKALDLKEEVITSPFSYVAATSSLVWEGVKPVFADVSEDTLTLSPDCIQNQIGEKTSGILATHVYGNPCEVDAIKELASRHKLKVIYDAAHAFGVKYNNTSILNYGDISILSFHATKLFHTIEGGGIVTSDDMLAEKIAYMRNFGHNGPEEFLGIGINGKASEFQAAMGLCILPQVDFLIEQRKLICERYIELLKGLPVKLLALQKNTTKYNYAYFPVFFESEKTLFKVREALSLQEINTRRYFYPSLNKLNYVEDNIPGSFAENAAKRVLCLPLFPELPMQVVERVSKIIKSAL